MTKMFFQTRSVWKLDALAENSNLTFLSGVPFPRNFRDTIRTIVRRLFRVYAHIYSNHFDQICALGIEGILSTPPQRTLTTP